MSNNPTIYYSIEALSTGGGRNGHVRTAGGEFEADMRAPKSLGGSGEGLNPEMLFAAGYAACFHSAVQGVARDRKVTVEGSAVGARVDLISDSGGFRIAVELEVTIPGLPHEEAQELAELAHARCPYSKATRNNIEFTLTVTDD